MDIRSARYVPAIGVGTLNISPRAKALVMEALNNNRLSYGPFMKRFERQFAGAHNCRFGILSNSGTSALQIALQTLKEIHGWADGDEVLVPSVTFVATANIVLHNRMKPVLVDVDRTYYEMDSTRVEAAITPRTKAMIPVHLFGQPADMDPLREIAKKHNLRVIEDSAETMYAKYKGQPVGSLGDIGCFSTYVAHLLVTGVGGLNTTNNPDYAVRLHSLVNHGRDSIYLSIDDDKGKDADELRMVIARRFKFTSIGHSFRVTEMEAALGLAQMEEANAILTARRANAAGLTQRLSKWSDKLQLPSIRPGNEHAFMMYPIVLRDAPKEELVNFLEGHGVGTRDMLPLTNQPVYKDVLGWKESDYPAAQWINNNGFYIGCHQDIGEDELDYMAELFERFFQKQAPGLHQKAALVLLTHNTQTAMPALFDDIPQELFDRIIAIDQGSSDGTVEWLKDKKVDVYSVNDQAIFQLLADPKLGIDEDNLLLFPADGRYFAQSIGRLMLALQKGLDMVVGSRFLEGATRRTPTEGKRYRSIGNRVFTILANLAGYGNSSDALSGFRAIKRSRLQELSLRTAHLEDFYKLSLHAMQRGWKVGEIPVTEQIHPAAIRPSRVLWSLIPLTWTLLRQSARR